MKNFWPQRSKVQGFSIKNIALNYREKLSNVSSAENLDEFSAERNLKSIIEDSNFVDTSNLSIKRGHWANRDFSEYREVA